MDFEKRLAGACLHRGQMEESTRHFDQALTLLGEVNPTSRLGIVWAPPFRVAATEAIQPKGNRLEIEVVNFWPNRIIGDQSLAEKERFTRTNVRKLTKDTPLMPSGLLGPVRLLSVGARE